jgi:type I restriction enzyme S subunit
VTGAAWRKVKLGEICSFKYGQMPKKSELAEKGYPVFSGYRVVGYSPKYHYRDPEIIVVARGVGGTGDIKMSPSFCFLTNLSIATLVVSPDVHKPFLFYRLAGTKLWDLRTGSAQAQITIERLREYEVSVPSLPVQRRIAGILSAYDELIENNQRRIKILEEMARSLYSEWFVHFRFPGHDKVKMVPSSLGPIPQGWEVNAIQQFGEVITGKTPSKANPDFYGQDVPFVKTPDMHGNMFILETGDRLSMAGAESQANKTIPAGSICVSCIGTIGVVSLTTEDCQTNQQINSVILARGETREFLFIQLYDLKQKLENLGSTGATMGNVNKGKFESMEILAPPDDLLERYHRLVEPTFSETLNLSRRIQNLRRTRDLLLPRLLSGQVLVTC